MSSIQRFVNFFKPKTVNTHNKAKTPDTENARAKDPVITQLTEVLKQKGALVTEGIGTSESHVELSKLSSAEPVNKKRSKNILTFVYDFFRGKKGKSLDPKLVQHQELIKQAASNRPNLRHVGQLGEQLRPASGVFYDVDLSEDVDLGADEVEKPKQHTSSLRQKISNLFKYFIGSRKNQSNSEALKPEKEKKSFVATMLSSFEGSKRFIRSIGEEVSKLWTKLSPSHRVHAEDSATIKKLHEDTFFNDSKKGDGVIVRDPLSRSSFVEDDDDAWIEGDFVNSIGNSPSRH